MSFFLHTGNAFATLNKPYNRASEFLINLPKALDFHSQWEVGLIEFMLNKDKLETKSCIGYVCVDFIENSILGNNTLPCIRAIHIPRYNKNINITFDRVDYFKINTKFIQNLRVVILDETGGTLHSTDQDLVFLSFHFRKTK